MLTKILSAAFIFFAIIAILPGIIKARKRYWVECVSRLIIIISSAFLSAWLTSIISMKLSELLLSLLSTYLESTEFNGILTEIPSAQKVLIALVAFAIANLIFFVLYTILKAILKGIFTKPLTKLFLLIGGAIMRKNYIAEVYGKKDKKEKKEKKKNKKKNDEPVIEETAAETTEQAPEAEADELKAEVVAESAPEGETVAVSEPVSEAEGEPEAVTETAPEAAVEAEVVPEDEGKKKKKKKEKKRKGRYGRWNYPKAALFGALCGFATYIIILVPIVASIELSVHMTNLAFPEGLPESITENMPEVISDVPDALLDNAGTKTVMTVGGRELYNLYATVYVDGEKVNFDNEITFIVDIVECITDLTDSDTTAEQKGAAIRSATEHIDNTVIIPSILAEFINEAGEDWIEGRSFHNIPCPSLGEGSEDMVIALLKCLQNSTAESIKEDLKSIVNIIAIIAENSTDGGVDFAAILQNKTLVSKISVEVLESERLAPMIKHLMVLNLSAPTPTISITLPDENDPTYNEFIDKVVTGYLDNVSVGNTAESLENVAGAVNQALVEHNVEIEEGMDTVIAAALISEFGDGNEMTSENLKSFISENITKYTTPAETV